MTKRHPQFVLNSNPLIIINAQKDKTKAHKYPKTKSKTAQDQRDFFFLSLSFFPFFSSPKFKIHILTSCIRFTEGFGFIKKAQFYVSSAFLALWWTLSPGQFRSSPDQPGSMLRSRDGLCWGSNTNNCVASCAGKMASNAGVFSHRAVFPLFVHPAGSSAQLHQPV